MVREKKANIITLPAAAGDLQNGLPQVWAQVQWCHFIKYFFFSRRTLIYGSWLHLLLELNEFFLCCWKTVESCVFLFVFVVAVLTRRASEHRGKDCLQKLFPKEKGVEGCFCVLLIVIPVSTLFFPKCVSYPSWKNSIVKSFIAPTPQW